MRINRRIRISILTAMGIVALAAVLLAVWVAVEKRKRFAMLTAELHRSEDRVRWAERMQRRGYVSKASLAAEHKHLAEVRAQIKGLGAAPKDP